MPLNERLGLKYRDIDGREIDDLFAFLKVRA
jgi:hypothetical protein